VPAWQSPVEFWGGAKVGIKPSSPVDITAAEGKLMITPFAEPALTLEELLTQVTDENLHVEIDAGPAMGAEDW
jgi:antitoxin component of MazEF toxin-antitoxin module